MDRRSLAKSALWAGLVSAAPTLLAQQASYPSKPIRFVAPFGAGGGSDVVARLLAMRLSIWPRRAPSKGSNRSS